MWIFWIKKEKLHKSRSSFIRSFQGYYLITICAFHSLRLDTSSKLSPKSPRKKHNTYRLHVGIWFALLLFCFLSGSKIQQMKAFICISDWWELCIYIHKSVDFVFYYEIFYSNVISDSSTDGPKSAHFDICSKNLKYKFSENAFNTNILKRLFIYSINKGVQTLEKYQSTCVLYLIWGK